MNMWSPRVRWPGSLGSGTRWRDGIRVQTRYGLEAGGDVTAAGPDVSIHWLRGPVQPSPIESRSNNISRNAAMLLATLNSHELFAGSLSFSSGSDVFHQNHCFIEDSQSTLTGRIDPIFRVSGEALCSRIRLRWLAFARTGRDQGQGHLVRYPPSTSAAQSGPASGHPCPAYSTAQLGA